MLEVLSCIPKKRRKHQFNKCRTQETFPRIQHQKAKKVASESLERCRCDVIPN
jgi:hypothetical protein